jgi:hypothetical protein
MVRKIKSSASKPKVDDGRKKSKIFTSKPFSLVVRNPDKIKNAEIRFTGLDTSKESYEARIFINNPKANHYTVKSERNGYAGSLFVFGHGSLCFGGPGHCKPEELQGLYDMRSSSDLKPIDQYLSITDYIKKICGKSTKITVTIVPILARYTENTDLVNVFKCTGMSLTVKS